LDNLDGNINKEEILSDSKVIEKKDKLNNIEMENNLETN